MAALPDPLRHYTRDEVRRLEEQGLLTGRWELIAGQLINKMGQNAPHSHVLAFLTVWLARLVGLRLRCQLPIEVGAGDQELNEPQPDLAVLREVKADFEERQPRGDEIALIIEVSDTSVRFDLTTKASLYARSGVAEYWVVDVPKRAVVIHRQPQRGTYEQVEHRTEDQSLSVAGSELVISSFLPRVRQPH